MKTYGAISSDGECFLRKNDKAMPPLAGHHILRFVRRIGPEKKIKFLEKDFMETEGINTSKHRHIQKFQETDDDVIISFKKAHDVQE